MNHSFRYFGIIMECRVWKLMGVTLYDRLFLGYLDMI